ncbi:MAG: hypothetical protein NTU74_14150 [Deltaproteobacteria bacterium]|nr:hypothetical protein [Deltaproteobacteria bacterium]
MTTRDVLKHIVMISCACLLIPVSSTASISNINEFLNTCPKNDPAYNQIKSGFTIRHNGAVVSFDDFYCTEPASSMNVSQYTDELIILQSLRVIYHMDFGRSGYLPWTSGTLYEWMKSKIKGFNIDDAAQYNSCCQQFSDGLYITLNVLDDLTRSADMTWFNLPYNIALYAHETRHVDGYAHVSCCGIPNGCDQTFDLKNLSPYGIQWWLINSFLNGNIDVGLSCGLSTSELSDTANYLLSGINDYQTRFCNNKPPTVTMPLHPGGPCPSNPDIKANGANAYYIAFPITTVSITASLSPGDWNGEMADYWFGANTPWGFYTLTTSGWSPGIQMLAQYPLINIPSIEILKASLPVGSYTFYFGVNKLSNTIPDSLLYFDSVNVNVINLYPITPIFFEETFLDPSE